MQVISSDCRVTPTKASTRVIKKFSAAFVERFDNAIGEKNQRVARLQIFRRSLVLGHRVDAQRHAANVQLLHIAVGPPQNRRIVSRVYLADSPRSRLVLGKDRRSESPAIQTMRASVAIQPYHQVRE